MSIERPIWYKLDGDTPVALPPGSYPTDAEWRTPQRWQIVSFAWFGLVRISTVFLFLDHSFPFAGNPTPKPVLWETMIFGGWRNNDQMRYTSAAEARRGHAQMVRRAWLALPFSLRGHV